MFAISQLRTAINSGVTLGRRYSTKVQKNGLNIAFFGSDEFSITVLKKLVDFEQKKDGVIANIDIITRRPKLAGRGLKELVEVPITNAASQYGRNVIHADSKAEINNLISHQYDLAIAVSYGRLIPAEFINKLKYCGLNVHPSLLPRYSGASPLQFALLNNDATTGVTVQTLHPTKFDQGQIVAQSEKVAIRPEETLVSLRDRLADIGGDMLVHCIASGAFKTVDRCLTISPYQYSYAGKITPLMKQIDWNVHTAAQLVRRLNVLGSLYSFKEVHIKRPKAGQPAVAYRRVIFYDFKVDHGCMNDVGQFSLSEDQTRILVKTKDGYVSCQRLKFECCAEEDANTFMRRLNKRTGNTKHVFIHSATL